MDAKFYRVYAKYSSIFGSLRRGGLIWQIYNALNLVNRSYWRVVMASVCGLLSTLAFAYEATNRHFEFETTDRNCRDDGELVRFNRETDVFSPMPEINGDRRLWFAPECEYIKYGSGHTDFDFDLTFFSDDRENEQDISNRKTNL